jgi:hypothetical protein
MTTRWQGPHYIALLAASGLAFGAGYMVAGRARPPSSPPLATNTSNGVEPVGIPGFDTNGQAPRGRPDENELIARNAEPLDGAEPPQGAGNSGRRAPPAEPRARPPREQPDDSKPTPSEPVEDDQGFDPDDR